MDQMVEKILITEEEITRRVKELGEEISKDYAGEEVMVLCVLKGAFVFASDLIRAISLPASINFMCLSSYGSGTTSSGKVQVTKDLDCPVEGKHVIIAEDVIDSGNTLHFLVDYLKEKGATSVDVCAIFDKPSRRQVEVEVRYIGFEIPDEFVIGYGLDYAENFRNLPYLGVLKREVYEG
ncbi:MAG: hypoxanthine phosphoribosyltransferase [Ruminococcaceae bacterium]|nr:hypoxanthine phosphoribosyltransferase [Oscillospiraceae bacterium]